MNEVIHQESKEVKESRKAALKSNKEILSVVSFHRFRPNNVEFRFQPIDDKGKPVGAPRIKVKNFTESQIASLEKFIKEVESGKNV